MTKEHMLVPTTYTLPGCLPPTPILAMEPEHTEGSPLSSNELGLDDEPQMEGQKTEASCHKQIFQESQPGHVPDDLRVVKIFQLYE
jgi:hypothetical protein